MAQQVIRARRGTWYDPELSARLLELCDGADLLIHDAQYTLAEFEQKAHWGHCTVDYAVRVAKEAGVRWMDDACYRLGAAFAYYALFSIFPLMLLSITAVGFVLGSDESARQRVLSSVPVPSPEFRVLLDQTLQSMQTHRTARGLGAVVGAVALFLGASGVFSELESSLDLIWKVKSRRSKGVWSSLLEALQSKAISFAVVVIAAAAVLASLKCSRRLRSSR